MKFKYLFCLSLVLLSLLVGCGNTETKLVGIEPENMPSEGLMDGEKKIYSENGKLHSIVEYKNGKANGRVRKYFEDGKLYMDAVYSDGLKNGKCIYYYRNGIAFTVSEYKKGYKDGVEKKYYEEGGIMAISNFSKNKWLPGLQEYKKDGSLVVDNTQIVIKEIDQSALNETFIIKVSLSNPRIVAKFTAVEANDSKIVFPLKASGNSGILEIPIRNGGFFMKKLLFTAEYKTTRGNVRMLQKNYNVAIDM